jgi:hypothetical protein
MGKFIIGVLLLGFAISGTSADPLFESDELLTLTVKGSLKQLNRERDKSVTYSPASLTYMDGDKAVEIPISLQPRGNRRLAYNTCTFPPLRLIFEKASTKKTLFAKQKKLKLVTQCYPKTKLYEQYLVTEYLIYRIFNLLTPNSYQVRLVSIDYIDEGGKPLNSNLAFFIEPNKRLAKRIGRKYLKIIETDATKLEGEHLNLISLVQLMLGNTDWSATHGGNEECCHNGKLFGEEGRTDNLFIPYDFDITGLVNPKYSGVQSALGLSSVRERRYRGYCRNTGYLEKNIALLNAKREEIFGLFENSPYMIKSISKKKIAYLKKFYKLINNPKKVDKMIHGWCHKSEFIVVEE